MRLGLWLSCVYVFAVFFRPQELYPQLVPFENLMDVLGGVAVAATLLDVAAGARPDLRKPQVALLAFFVLWAALTVFLTSRWLGGAVLAFQQLSTNVFLFFITVLGGAELSRIKALRRAALAAIVLIAGYGLRAYYLGPREQDLVVEERLLDEDEPTGREESLVSDLTTRLTGRGTRAGAEASARAEAADGPRREGPADAPESAVPTVRRLRALGPLNDPNDFAQLLVAALPLVFLAWQPRRPLANVVFAVLPAALMIWAIVLTRSRGGLVSLAALSWFALIPRAGPRWERMLRWLGVAVLFVALTAFFRLGEADDSARGRLAAWSEGLQMLKESPVWGIGFGSFSDEYDLVAHNSYVHCFAELGLVGYFAWLGAIVACFLHLARVRAAAAEDAAPPGLARWARALSLSLAAFLCAALFLSRSYSLSLFFLLGLATAVAGLAARTTGFSERFAVSTWSLVGRTAPLMAASVVLTYAVVVLGRP
jgi:O-antigen ligase